MAAGATQKRSSRPAVVSKTAWTQLAVHRVHLPSGAVVDIKIPDLSLLIAGGAVPEKLKHTALRELTQQIRDVHEPTALGETAGQSLIDEEHIIGLAELTRWLVTQTLVDPKVTEAEIASGVVPNEDLVMLTQIASRERNTDARGVELGIEPIDRWEVFRQYHGCEETCSKCDHAIEELSTRAR